MLTKGIIQSIKDGKAVISVPALGQLQDNLNIDLSQMPKASIMNIPGLNPQYRSGDVVYVEMEDGNLFKPLILGIFSNNKDAICDARLGSLHVVSSAQLPSSTTINGLNVYERITNYDMLFDSLFTELTNICDSSFI